MGEFVTANTTKDKIKIWPRPSESDELMTAPKETFTCCDSIIGYMPFL